MHSLKVNIFKYSSESVISLYIYIPVFQIKVELIHKLPIIPFIAIVSGSQRHAPCLNT